MLFCIKSLNPKCRPMFCHSDIINYGNLHNIDFKRTQTLCQGGKMCDFCFVKHRKGEVWERSKSL